MPYIPPEVIEQARQIDLLSYMQAFEPGELVRISVNNYTTRTYTLRFSIDSKLLLKFHH